MRKVQDPMPVAILSARSSPTKSLRASDPGPFSSCRPVRYFTWLVLNIYGFVHRWDPFPFILLNLLFSVQAAYTGPVLLLAGNRQSQKDRLTLEHAAYEADKADEQNVEILKAVSYTHLT